MNRILIFLAALSASALAFAQEPDNTAKTALARFQTLAGDWEGTMQWSGARTDKGPLSATYYVTGNNSAVVENLVMDGKPTMTSVYHLNGPELRMTHYCGAGNQPRLKAERIDLSQGTIEFSFVDATNLSSPEAPHVHGLKFHFIDPDHIAFTFLFQGGGKESQEQIALTRVKH